VNSTGLDSTHAELAEGRDYSARPRRKTGSGAADGAIVCHVCRCRSYLGCGQASRSRGLVDHVWMPRPAEVFEKLDPITADFTYIGWLGDRKGIKRLTQT